MTQVPMRFNLLLRALGRAWHLQKTVSALWSYLITAAFVSGALGLFTLVGVVLISMAPALVVGLGAGGGLVAAAVYQLMLRLTRPGPARLLRDADSSYGLRNLLETAWETRSGTSAFSDMLAGRAGDAIGRVRAACVYPLRRAVRWPRVLISAVALGAAVGFGSVAQPPEAEQMVDDPGTRLIEAARRLAAAAGDELERDLASELEELGGEVNDGQGIEERGRYLLERIQEQIGGLERAPVGAETPTEEFPEDSGDTKPQALRTSEEEGDREVMVSPSGREAADGVQEEADELDNSDVINTAEDFLDGTETEREGQTPPSASDPEGERREALAEAEDALRESMENVTGGIGDLELEEGEAGEAGDETTGRGNGRERRPEEARDESLGESGDENGSLGGTTPAEDGMEDDFERLTMPEERAPFSELEGETQDGPILDLLLREPPDEGSTRRAEEPPVGVVGPARETPVDLEAVPAALRSYVRDYFLRVARDGAPGGNDGAGAPESNAPGSNE